MKNSFTTKQLELFGMTRAPGESAWCDHLVRRFRRTDQISRLVRKQLDGLLAEWTFSEWTL